MAAPSPESVRAMYLGAQLDISERDVLVSLGGRPVRVASVPSARRLVRQLRRLSRMEATA